MAANHITLHSGSNNPFEQSRCKLIEKLALERVPAMPAAFPKPDDFLEWRDWIITVAKICGELVADVGHYAKYTASHSVDMTLFENVFVDAIQGNATYELECAAMSAAEGHEEERED